MGFQGTIPDDAFHLGDDDAAIVVGGHGEIERADIGAFVLEGEIAALVRRGGADDGDIGNDGGEIEPLFALEIYFLHDWRGGGLCIHGAAFVDGIDESIETDFGEHAGALGGGFAVDVKHDAGGHIVGGDFVCTQHLPDQRWFR